MTSHADDAPAPENEPFESSGDDALDARLAEGVLKGHQGLETAQAAMSAFLIVVAAFLALSPIFSAPFSHEAQRLVVENAPLHQAATVAAGIAEAPHRPLGMLALALNWRMAPGSALAFHVVGFLLHAASAVLLFLCARKLLTLHGDNVPEPVAMLAGMFFTLHPLAGSAVVDVAARPEALSAALLLLALLAYLRGRERSLGEAPGAFIAGIAAFAGAVASHPAALAFPILLAAVEWIAPDARLRRTLPFWVVAAAYLAVWRGTAGAFPLRPLTPEAWSWASAGYLVQRMVLPVRLSVFPVPSGGETLVAVIGLAAGVAVGAALLVRRSPAGVAMIWWTAMTAFALWFAPDGLRERLAYFPLAGACLLAPWLFGFLRPQAVRAVVGLAAALLLIVLGGMSFARANVWLDPLRLWTDAVEKAPDAPVPNERLGLLYLARARGIAETELARSDLLAEEARDAALFHLTRAKELGARTPRVFDGLGQLHLWKGDLDAAQEAFREALRRLPDDAGILSTAAHAHAARGFERNDRRALAQAARYFEAAAATAPLTPPLLISQARVLAALGRHEEAARALTRAATPGDARLTGEADHLRDRAAAVSQLAGRADEVRRSDPLQALALDAQAETLRGQPMEALYRASYALARRPGDWQAWTALAVAKAGLGDIEAFLASHMPPPDTPEGVPPAWRMAAGRIAFLGDWGAARRLTEAVGKADHPDLEMARIAQELGHSDLADEFLQEAERRGAPAEAVRQMRGETEPTTTRPSVPTMR